MGSQANDLRRRGFRPVSTEFLQLGDIARLAVMFGYEVVKATDTIWLRKRERREGVPLVAAIKVGPTIRKDDVSDPRTYEFLRDYRGSAYAAEQDKLVHYKTDSIRASLAKGLQLSEPFRRWHSLVRTVAFTNSIQLRSILEGSLLPAFFEQDPEGRVQVFMLNEEVDRQFGWLRATYSMSHYPLDLLRASGQRFASLVEWDSAVPVDYLEAVLSIIQASTYPYMQMFHGGPFGLSFVFVLSKPESVELDVFPRSWLHWTRSGSEFGIERLDGVATLRDPDSMTAQKVAHRRYLVETPLSCDAVHELLLWTVNRLSSLMSDLSDPANFERNGSIDFVFSFEHNLSMLRVFRRAIHILGSEEPPSGKLTVFEMADLLEELANAFRDEKKGADSLFKQLFNPVLGRQVCEECFQILPVEARGFFLQMADSVYEDLEKTVERSLWVKDTVKDGMVRVKSRDLTREVEEEFGRFVGNLMRALRNTHHGYFSRLDPRNRPSRYLAMSTGNIPDSLSSLSVLWALCLLANPQAVTGWTPLGFGSYA